MLELKGVEEAIEAEVQRRVASYLTELAYSVRNSASARKAWSKRKAFGAHCESSPKAAAAGDRPTCSHCGKKLRSNSKQGMCSKCRLTGKAPAPATDAA